MAVEIINNNKYTYNSKVNNNNSLPLSLNNKPRPRILSEGHGCPGP
jgi:hypothetical protein